MRAGRPEAFFPLISTPAAETPSTTASLSRCPSYENEDSGLWSIALAVAQQARVAVSASLAACRISTIRHSPSIHDKFNSGAIAPTPANKSPAKSADNSDKRAAKLRNISHDRLTAREILIICKILHMNTFQANENGAEVTGARVRIPLGSPLLGACRRLIRGHFEP